MQILQPISVPLDIRLRWLTIACFEVRIGDFSIVIDPCIGAAPHAPFDADVIEKADLILLSHGHWDHTTDIKMLAERFECPVLCGELTAPALAKMLDINPCRIYPMSPNLELDFGAARVRALFGRHTDQRKPLHEITAQINTKPYVQTDAERETNWFGNLEYRNYLITAPSGLKVLFWGNNVSLEQLSAIRTMQPDIAMLQYTKQKPEELAEMIAAGNVKVLIPHHMDLTRSDAEYAPLLDLLETEVHKRAPGCLVVHPERLQWLSFGLSVTPV